MRENETSVLEQYDIDVKSTQKIRGAFLCNTNEGLFLLKEMKISEKRIPMLDILCRRLKENGYDRVDEMVTNKDNEFVSTSEDGVKYILKRWFNGKECDIRKEKDVIETTKNLAQIHKILCGEMEWGEEAGKLVLSGEDLRNEYYRHNRELKKVRAFIRKKVGKGEFELTFLKNFDVMYEWAEKTSARLEESDYEKLLQESWENKTITHGDYNYHNVLMTTEGIATTNFDHFRENIQAADLYYFLRKTMEKHQWEEKLGNKILEAYDGIRTLTREELEYIAICLAYPEKFWKAANSYCRSRKTWISVKSLEKINMAILQTEEKKRFLETIFSFHL